MVIYLPNTETIIIDNWLLTKKLYTLSEACKVMQLEEDHLEVRLRVFEGNWELLSGDPQYDTDHRGYWGYGCLRIGSSCKDCIELAIDLQRDLINNFEE